MSEQHEQSGQHDGSVHDSVELEEQPVVDLVGEADEDCAHSGVNGTGDDGHGTLPHNGEPARSGGEHGEEAALYGPSSGSGPRARRWFGTVFYTDKAELTRAVSALQPKWAIIAKMNSKTEQSQMR